MRDPITAESSNHLPATKIQNSETSNYLKYLEAIAVVTDTIYPSRPGRIHYQGSWWPALCTQNVILPVSSTVRVIGMKAITCIVEPFQL